MPLRTPLIQTRVPKSLLSESWVVEDRKLKFQLKKSREMLLLCLVVHMVRAQRWKTQLPQATVIFEIRFKIKKVDLSQFNTGKVYAFTTSYDEVRRLGPVCFGSREYAIQKATNTSRVSDFADKVCYENGFLRRANFVGKRTAYLDFMEKWYGTAVRDYFEMIYADQNSLEYVIGNLE